MKRERENFRFKSFMAELILAHLSDQGHDFSDYPEALQHFFTYLAKSKIRTQILFTDYYNSAEVGSFTEPVQIIVVRRFVFTRHNVKTANYISMYILPLDHILS